ncbi:Abscisic acid 8'-hydroxylase 3 [Nymphaea thermarum]|nr:Abscisic acid 8'-hydroxylase 3 [Nymphaea thermarum]
MYAIVVELTFNCLPFFLLCVILLFLLRMFCNKVNSVSSRLPPGSMGLPYVGETLQLYSKDPSIFFATRQKRYGEIFKTHVLGCPCVVLASPQAAKFVLVSHAELFKPTYPRTKMALIGPSALFFHDGSYHMRLRKLVQGPLQPDGLRSLLRDVEAIAERAVDTWSHGRVVNTFAEMKKYAFDVGIISIIGRLDDERKEELKRNYCVVDKGYNSFFNRIPGTSYHKAILARRRLGTILSKLIEERKAKGEVRDDLLGNLINYKAQNGESLSEEEIADNVIGVLFAAQDTTASALTWLLKYLYENPKIQDFVRAEQMAIHEENDRGKKGLTLAQTKNMPFTSRVIMETLRKASILSFTYREAVVDVEYKGYLIPKGWKVLPLFRNIHHNPEFFPDPQKFDPSRFEVTPKPNTFMPFGNGVHSCPGSELAKLEMLVLVHHLVTKYRWEVVGSDNEVEYGPFPVPRRGLPAKFWKAHHG